MSDKTVLSNSAYDKLKTTAQIILPACGTLYFGLSKIWGLPNGEEVVGTIAILDTFLGVLLSSLSKNYHESDAAFDGDIVVENAIVDGLPKKVFTFAFNDEPDPDQLAARDKMSFKIVRKGLLESDKYGPDPFRKPSH